MSKVELKNVKEFSGMEGPGGFNCTVYIDGVRVGTAMNEGNGGCNFYQPWDIKEVIERIAQTEHKFEVDFEVADQLIGRLLDRIAIEKIVKRTLKTRMYFVRESGIYETGKVSDELRARTLANPKEALKKLKADRFVTDVNEVVDLILAQS